jgi:PAS domain S-box-containing protein
MPEINLLLVDDEPEISTLMQMMLKKQAPQFRIRSAGSGREALDLLRKDNIDCVLSDYQMPGMDGLELLREIREAGQDVPFIFLTGQGNEEIASEAFKDGANDYFTKEIGFAHFPRIINSVEQAVSQRKARAAEARYQVEILEYSRKLEALTSAARLVNMDLETKVVLKRLVDAAIEIVSGTSGAAGIYMDGQMVFDEYNRGGEIITIDYAFGPGSGVPGYVMETMSAYITNDAENDPHVVPDIRKALGFTSLVDVPIINRDGKLLGCFEIHDKKGGAGFDEQDVELLQGLAASTAVALENSKLIQGVKTAKKEWEETFNAIDDPVTIHDAEFNIVQANAAAARVLGMDASDIIGRKCYELFHHMGAPIDNCPGAELVNGTASIITHEVEVKDRYFEVSVYPLRMEDGFRGFVHVAKDITERKLADEEKARARRELDTLLQSVQFGMMVVGRDKRIRRVNRAAMKMMGYDDDSELVGRMCYDNICTAGMNTCPVLDLGQAIDHSVRTMVDKSGRHKKIVKSVTLVTLDDEEVLLESFVELKGDLGMLKAA